MWEFACRKYVGLYTQVQCRVGNEACWTGQEKLNFAADATKTTGSSQSEVACRDILNGGMRSHTLCPLMDQSLDTSGSQKGATTLSWVDLFGQGQLLERDAGESHQPPVVLVAG